MNVNRVTAQNVEIYRQAEIKKMDHSHKELAQEDRRVKERLENNEQKRIEMNRWMNRPGQHIDRMA